MLNIEERFWKKTRRYIKFLQMVPFLRMVAVCNNLAFSRVNEKSDIDLFIIAKSGRLFLVRILVTFLLQILGVRRHGKKVFGRFCLSFYVDDEFLNLSKIAIPNDIYLAYWLKTMKILIDDGVSRDFAMKNLWAEDFFEEKLCFGDGYFLPKSRIRNVIKKIGMFIFGGRFGNFLERKLKNWQMKRAQEKSLRVPNPSGLIIGEHILKFHAEERRPIYRDRYMQKFGAQKILTENFQQILDKN